MVRKPRSNGGVGGGTRHGGAEGAGRRETGRRGHVSEMAMVTPLSTYLPLIRTGKKVVQDYIYPRNAMLV